MKKFALLIMLTMGMGAFAQNETLVVIKTEFGEITAKLYNDTPLHRDNFIKLVKQGWYNGSPFHRVIQNFMIQGGGNENGQNDPGYLIDAEFHNHHIHKKGALAAARMGDQVNPQKKSSGSQFYIVQGQKFMEAQLKSMAAQTNFPYTEEHYKTYATVGGTPHLDGSYTVFGEVVHGFEVIDKIAAVQTARGDRPVNDVKMTIEILE
jgi:cyclophilin family peptidyl-prolyl cis-trans isomerase